MGSKADRYERLKASQESFRSLFDGQVLPALGISKDATDRMTWTEIAARIEDKTLRREFATRARAMLLENISYYAGDAEIRPPPVPNIAVPVVLSLLAAAGGLYLWGPVAALIAAAAGFALGYIEGRGDADRRRSEAKAHNELAPDWQKSLDEWNQDVRELDELLGYRVD